MIRALGYSVHVQSAENREGRIRGGGVMDGSLQSASDK